MDEAKISLTLKEIINEHEIKKVLATYCHGCDRGDEALMASVYADESWDDHGNYKGSGKGFAAYVMKLQETDPIAYSHLLGQTLIRVNGDAAGAETYFLASGVNVDAKGERVVNLIAGRYVDTLQRFDGSWKIAKRLCVREWSMTLDVQADWLKGADFIPAQTLGLDVSSAILGLVNANAKLRG